MKIIDAHMHYSKIDSFQQASKKNGVVYTREGLVRENQKNNIVAGICMGLNETVTGSFPDDMSQTPMGCDLDEIPRNLYYCAGINPLNLRGEALHRLDRAIDSKQCVGIKIYAGYYYFMVTDKIYLPAYELALKYNVPVVIHSGDTYSERGLLKYSHPLAIDELAVNNPDMVIIIAHLGNPWLMDTAEILYKNKNVYADLSGLLVGDKALFERFCSQELYMNMFKTALILADHYDKLLFGTDWPLVPIDVYIDFIKKLVPGEHYADVFYGNALKVFTKLRVE